MSEQNRSVILVSCIAVLLVAAMVLSYIFFNSSENRILNGETPNPNRYHQPEDQKGAAKPLKGMADKHEPVASTQRPSPLISEQPKPWQSIILDQSRDWVDRILLALSQEIESIPISGEKIDYIASILNKTSQTSAADEEDVRKGAALLHLAKIADADQSVRGRAFELVKRFLIHQENEVTSVYAIAALFGTHQSFKLYNLENFIAVKLYMSTSPPTDPRQQMTQEPSLAFLDLARKDASLLGALEGNLRIEENNSKPQLKRFVLEALYNADPAALAQRAEAIELLHDNSLSHLVSDYLLKTQDARAIQLLQSHEIEKLTQSEGIPNVSLKLAAEGYFSQEDTVRKVAARVLSDGSADLAARYDAVEYLSRYLAQPSSTSTGTWRDLLGRIISDDEPAYLADVVIRQAVHRRDQEFVPYLRIAMESVKGEYLRDLIGYGLNELDAEYDRPASLTKQLEDLKSDYAGLQAEGLSDQDLEPLRVEMAELRRQLTSMRPRRKR